MKTERRLKELGIELAKPTSPMANYVNAVRTGNLLYLAGKGPGLPGHPLPVGKVGRDFTKEQGYEYARQTGLSLIAVMKAELGDLDRVKRIVKLLGMVNCTPELGEQPEVINGCSDLFVSVFGDRGVGSDAALDVARLPDLDHLHHRLGRPRLDRRDPFRRFRAMELQQVDGAGGQPLIEQRIVGIDE